MKPTISEKSKIDVKKFKKGKKISQGGFGYVYEVEDRETNDLYAAKIIFCHDDEDECNRLIDREVCTMLHIQHPTIIKFIGYSATDFNGANNVVILMELAKNGSLYGVIENIMKGYGPHDYTNTTRQIILVGVARGMKYLHDRNIIHRDLKLGNILLSSEFRPLITDFGMSKFFEVGHSYSQSSYGGTKPYQAPEIVKGENYGPEVDVYAFGILMFEILNDSFAYPELLQKKMSEYDFNKKLIDENYRPVFTYNPKKSLKRLVEKCWSGDPKKRPTFSEIFNKLSKTDFKNDDNNEEEEDYLLEEVDIDELNDYVLDITEINDTTEKLLSKIKKIEKQNQQLKKENSSLKTENEQNLSKIEKIEKESLQFKTTINKLEKENEQLLNEIAQFKNLNKNQLDTIKTKENETKILNDIISKLKAEKKDDSEQINMIQNDNNQLKFMINKLEKSINQTKIEKDKLIDQIDQIKAENEKKYREDKNRAIEYICNFNLFYEGIPGLNLSFFKKYIEKLLDLTFEFRRLINTIEQNSNELLYLFQDTTNKNDNKDQIQVQITQFDIIIQNLIKEKGIQTKFKIIDNFYLKNCINELKTSLIEHFYPLVKDIPNLETPHDKYFTKRDLFQDFDPDKNKGKVDFEQFKLIEPPKDLEHHIKDENFILQYDKFVSVINLIISLRNLQTFSNKYENNCKEINKQEILLTKEQIFKMKPEEIKNVIEYTSGFISNEYKILKVQNKQLTTSNECLFIKNKNLQEKFAKEKLNYQIESENIKKQINEINEEKKNLDDMKNTMEKERNQIKSEKSKIIELKQKFKIAKKRVENDKNQIEEEKRKIEELEKLVKLEKCQIEEEKNKLIEISKQIGPSQISDRIEGIGMAINSLIFPIIKSHPKKDDIQKFNNQVNQLKNSIDIIKSEILEIREKYMINNNLLINQNKLLSIKK